MTVLTTPAGASSTRTPDEAPRRQRAARRPKMLSNLFLVALILYFALPLWWLLVASTKDTTSLFASPHGALWFGDGFHLVENLRALFAYDNGIYLRWMGNSFLYALAGGLGSTVLAVLAGYGFAKFHFKGRNLAFSILLGAVMVPATALVIPTFVLLSEMELTNTPWAVILPSLLNPFGVYLMRVYAAEGVPDELLDAARVDGAGTFRTFFQVALPLLRPAIVTVLLLSVVATWNNYFLPLAMLSDSTLFPVTVGIGLLQGLAGANNGGGESLWMLIVVGSLVSIIPLIIAFLSLQKYWQGGLAIGSLK